MGDFSATRVCRLRRVSTLFVRLASLVAVWSGMVHAQSPPQGTVFQVQPPQSVAVSVMHEGGVEIITSRTIPQLPTVATMPSAGDASAAQRGALPVPSDGAAVSQFIRPRQHAPMNATLSARDSGVVADDVRGDHRLRANLLNADGTANEQADNSAHQLVNVRRAEAQADLKDALSAFDAAKRSGASRTKLNELQAQIRTDLDEIHILTRSQQTGAQ